LIFIRFIAQLALNGGLKPDFITGARFSPVFNSSGEARPDDPALRGIVGFFLRSDDRKELCGMFADEQE